TPDGDGRALNRPAELAGELVDEALLLILVDRLNRVDKKRLMSRGLGDVLHGCDVFGKTASAISASGAKKCRTDARVRSDALANVFDVRAVMLAEDRHLVHERDARRQHAVGGIFRQLGALPVHREEVFFALDEWIVEPSHLAERFGAFAAD